MTSPHLDLRGATARRRSAWPLGGSGTTATTMCATARFQLDLRAVTARRRSALRATEVRMYPRSGPRTDGRCAEGPRVEWLDGEARPTDDPARGAERPDRTTPPQLFLKPSSSLGLPCRTAGPYEPAPTFPKNRFLQATYSG